MLTKGVSGIFRERPLQSAWPDNPALGNQRRKSDQPLKSDAQRAEDARKKWSGIVEAADLHGQPLRVPRIWGDSPGAVDARQHGAQLTGRGVVYPQSSSGPGVKASLVEAPDADVDRTWRPRPDAALLGRSEIAMLAPTPKVERDEKGKIRGVVDPYEVRGLRTAVQLYRTSPIVGSVAGAPHVTLADVRLIAGVVGFFTGGVVRDLVKSLLRFCSARPTGHGRKVSPQKAAAVATHRVAVTPLVVTEIEIARIKRAAQGIILCDARKAPPRAGIVAF